MTIQDIKSQNLILFEAIAGSKAFGLDTATSDTDIKGVFYLPKDLFYGLEYIPQISNETNDIVYYELGRFIELLNKNNPNILELLASPDECILYKHPIMERIKIEYFLSKLCKETFAGYAGTQIKKAQGLKKKIVNPLPVERKDLLDFCFIIEAENSISIKEWLQRNNFNQENCGLVNIHHTKGVYALFYDADKKLNYHGIIKNVESNEVSLSSIPKGEKCKATFYFNVESYSSYCKEYREYWEWVENRNQDRFQLNENHGKNYDSKNMMHTIRLLQVAEEIIRHGKLNVRRNNREELLSIKRGEWEYDTLLKKADELLQSIQFHFASSKLQNKPNTDKSIGMLVEIRKQLYK
jgi:hypothetical protein